jgi:hypothetical protein
MVYHATILFNPRLSGVNIIGIASTLMLAKANR